MAKEWTGVSRRERKFAVKVKSPGECKRVLSIEIPKEELDYEEGLVVSELRRDLKVPGFRKGKVPLKYIEKNYKEAIRGDAVRNLLPSVYEDALVREGIKPVGEPKFENVQTDEGETIRFDVSVEVRPTIDIDGYRGIKVKVTKRKIEDSHMNDVLENLRERLGTLRVVDRAVREDDFVLIDYGPLLDSGAIDQKLLATNYPVDLSGENLLKEFREGLLGMTTGEEKDVFVHYPEDFPDKKAAGTSKTFRIKVKEIKQKDLPELNDDFAKRVGEQFASLDSLKEKIEEDLNKDEDKRVEHEAEERVIDKLIEKRPFEVPDVMVRNYIASLLEEDRKRRPNVPDEADRERELRERFYDAAVRTIKKYFILEAVRKRENIEVSREEVDRRIEELAGEGSHQPEEIKAFFSHPQRRQNLENEILDRKVLDFLREGADVKVAQ
ncbi:MAG: trigger factor [Candidatus Krumholzibacteria bacterium]|nr:trigger factor [Candidatus Krumholzibacteria bacterium]